MYFNPPQDPVTSLCPLLLTPPDNAFHTHVPLLSLQTTFHNEQKHVTLGLFGCFLMELASELRALHLPSRNSITWAMPLVHLALVILEMGVSWTISLGWPWTMILPISAFQVANITGVSHLCLVILGFLSLAYFAQYDEWLKKDFFFLRCKITGLDCTRERDTTNKILRSGKQQCDSHIWDRSV
jgi:hypothetical protein